VLTHSGHWVQPPRGWATGRLSKPRWLPLPQLPYAQVGKQIRRRRLVAVSSRVVFRYPGGDQAGPGSLGVAAQHGLHRARQSHDPPACGRGGPAGDDLVQRYGGGRPTTGPLSPVRQFLFAPCPFTPAFTPACTDHRDGLGAMLAPVYASEGRGPDGSRVDAACGGRVWRAAVAPAPNAVRGS
jgi:hypothetical protein